MAAVKCEICGNTMAAGDGAQVCNGLVVRADPQGRAYTKDPSTGNLRLAKDGEKLVITGEVHAPFVMKKVGAKKTTAKKTGRKKS